MSQTVITQAFETLKAQEAANGGVVTLDEFVFASVPNLNITDPINRAEGLPDAEQIVHRQAVNKTGMVNNNAVVYSVVLGADVGDFDFNWVGLLNKASGVVAMIVHAPLQKKIKTASGQQGNVLTRSFLMEYNGASQQTLITTPADTWQIDFTARLNGVDERIRKENRDTYGPASFLNDGFQVSGANGSYLVKNGVAYIDGVRAELHFDQAMTVSVCPSRIWVDVCWRGTLTSVWAAETKLTVADALENYVAGDEQHYVFAIADIRADGSVIDLRPTSILDQLVNNVAAMKASSLLPGSTVTTRGYYHFSESDTIGSAVYDIVTQEKYGATPDGYLNHALQNGCVALARIPDAGLTFEMYGSHPDLADSCPAFRAAMKSGNEVFLDYDCTFDSSLGAVPGVASGPCIALDAVSDLSVSGRARRLGRRPKILMGATRAAFNNNFFTYFVSAASQSAGHYSRRNKLRNIELVFNRTPALVGDISGVNTTSCEDFTLRNMKFSGGGLTGTLGVPGTGGIGNRYEKNEFDGVSTPFDNSQMQDCVFIGNTLIGRSNAVTGFNHFYDAITIANVRLSRPLAKSLGNNNVYRENEVIGYGSAFSVRGMQDSRVVSNHIHSFTANDATERTLISIYTDSESKNVGQMTSGILVKDNNIHDVKNTGGGTLRAIYVRRTVLLPVGPCVITCNIIANMPNGIGISLDDDSSTDRVTDNIVDPATVGTPYSRNIVFIKPGSTTGGSASIEASTGDLVLKGAEGRYVRFGSMVNGAGTIQGYINIRDEAGNVRKLAVIS